jgi:UDPglucose--hexose-1-phosphate uridylyltransferase
VLHTAPPGEDAPHYHWHWEILPRLTGIAGYELATGCYLNPLPPEEAAKKLREFTTDAHG